MASDNGPSPVALAPTEVPTQSAPSREPGPMPVDQSTEAKPSGGEVKKPPVIQLPSVHFPTLAAAAGISVFFYGLVINSQNDLAGRIDQIASRLENIPTRDELGEEIEQVASIQRATWEANTARVEASAISAAAAVDGVREQLESQRDVSAMLNDRVNMLDDRIANLGRDFSGALVEYFARPASSGNEGGPEGDDELYRDYAVSLAVRDGGMSPREAVRFVDRAFMNMRGPEARRIVELARAAQQSGRGMMVRE